MSKEKVAYIAHRTDNCFQISPVDSLKALIKEIECGDIEPRSLCILIRTKGNLFKYRNSQLTKGDACLLLNTALFSFMERMMDGE